MLWADITYVSILILKIQNPKELHDFFIYNDNLGRENILCFELSSDT